MTDEQLKAQFDAIELAQHRANGESLARRVALRKAPRKRKRKEEVPDHMHDGTTAGEACELCGPIIEELK
jgi:hypothetical protein